MSNDVFDTRSLLRELQNRRVADWVVTERRQELGLVDAALDARAALRRRETRTRWTLVVHDDTPAGRGSAHLTIDGAGGRAREIVDQALALAGAAIGPAWRSPSLAAPARVQLADPAIAHSDLVELAAAAAGEVRGAAGLSVRARVELLREDVDAHSRGGLRATWSATALRGTALVATATRSLEVAREARRIVDLDLPRAVASAAADLRVLDGGAAAAAPIAGACAVVLRTEALLHGGGFGVWAVFAAQADAVVERQGLARYRVGAPVAPGADTLDESLAIASDGALDFAAGSAPIAEGGDAIRRFAIVDDGIAAGLALTPREAALRGVDPNGGMRNLVVTPGSWSGDADVGATRVVEVQRLRSLAIDPYTGDATLEIALAVDHVRGEARPFAGGTLHLDLIAALARAHRSRATVRRGSYDGPAAVWFDGAELIA